MVVLEDEADDVAMEVAVGRIRDRDPVDLDRARGGPVEVADDRQQRGLAGAGRAREDDELAGLDRQGDAVNGDDRPRVHATDVPNDDARPAGIAGITP